MLTPSGFSPIFAFMDHDSQGASTYVHLRTASGATLYLTPDHIVWAHEPKVPVHADAVAVGDVVWVHSSAVAANATALPLGALPSAMQEHPSVVVGVSASLRQGRHAPLTKDGSIVVDGVSASCFAVSRSLTWGEGEAAPVLASGHLINKWMHAPLRWWCEASPGVCGRDWHTAEGRHLWTQWILDHSEWLQAANSAHSNLQTAAFGANAGIVSRLALVAQVAAAAVLAAAYYLVFAFSPHAVAATIASGAACRCALAGWATIGGGQTPKKGL